MPQSLKVEKKNNKWDSDTANLCGTNATHIHQVIDEKSQSIFVHPPGNVHKDFKSPRRIVASPHRFKTQISKIINTRETQQRSPRAYRRSINGNQISKSLSGGEIGCSECKSCRGINRSTGNSQRTKTFEFSQSDNKLQTNLVNKKIIFLDPKSELAVRSSIKKEEIKQRLEQLRKNTNRLIRKSIQRKMIQEGNDKSIKTLKYRGLEKTQQKLDRSLKEANTRQSEIQNIKFFAKNIDSSFNQKQPFLKIVKTPAVNNDTKSFKPFAEDIKSTADSRTFTRTLDFQKRKQNTNSIDTLHSNIENDNCLIGCYKSSDTPTRTSPLLQSQYQNMRMICKPGNEELSYCNIGTVSCDNKSQCLKDECNDEMSSLCLEKLPAHLITVNSSDYNLKYPIDTFENLSCDTNVRKTEMPFWLRPSPIHIYPYNFVLAVRRKLEYIVNPPLSRMESTESIETKQCADKNTMESVVSNALVISGADRKLHSLTDSPHRLNSYVRSKSSKMCIMNEIGTTEANHVSEENSDAFKNDDTTISSSIFDSPKTMDAERNMMLSSISPLPPLNNDQIENNFDTDNNLNQLLDDFNNSLSHAMQVNEQIKNKTRLSCSSREESMDNLLKNGIRLRDYQDSSRGSLSNQLKDKNSCAGVKSFNSECPSNQYELIRTTINEELDSKMCTSETAKIKNTSVDNNSDYLTEIEPVSVSPLNLPNLRLTHFNDTHQKRLNQMEYSSSTELDYEQSQHNTRSLITKISQQRRTKNCKNEVSICDYSNGAKYIVQESLEPSENLVKKASVKTTLNVESIKKTKSNAGNGYMVSKSSKIPFESRHTFKDVVCGNKVNKTCDMPVLSQRDAYNLLSPPECNATVSKFNRADLGSRQSSPSTSYPSPPSSSTIATSKTETMAIDQFKTLLQTGEKILLDRTKSQIAWLEVLKDHYKENGLVTHIATVKKKQRGLLLKLDQEREKIKRLLYSTRPSLELNMPTENKSSKLLSTESRRKSFSIEGKSTNRTKSIQSTSATTYRGHIVDNPRLMDYMLRQRGLDLNKKSIQKDVIVCDQQINGEATEVLKLEQAYLKSCNIPMQRNSPSLLIDGIVRKGKVEDDFKETYESTEDIALQRLKSRQMKKIEPNGSCNLLKNELVCEYGDSQTAVTHDCARKCNRKVANDVFQMNELIMQEIENKNETARSSDQCNDSADECSFSKKQSVNCPCAFEMDFREGATSGTDTESLYSARQEILERNKLIERNITKFVSMTKDIISQHVSLRRSFSDNQVYQESIGERSDYCKTWPNRRKMFYFKRFSTNPAIICSSKKTTNKLKNSTPNSEKTSMVDVKQLNENCVHTSYVDTPRKILSTNDEVTATGHYSKYDCKNEQVKELEMGIQMIESTDTRINSKCEISKTENAPSYYESTVSNTEDNLLSKRCQNEIVSENFSILHSKTDTEKDRIPSVLSETAKDCLHESKIVTEFQIQSIDKSMSKSDNSLENASKQLPICSELTYDRDADQVLTKANSPLKDNVKNRQRQIKNNIHAETNVREIPNKPPPPYVPPAPGSPMTTIFPSEERIRDITFRRSHELFCHLLKIDYTSPKGDKLPSLMEERITNIYERIILDICQEYLNDHMDVVSQGNPADFHGQLAFFNPPDRLSCIQNAIYKEVQKCLALHKSSPKRHQVFSIYGQRAKRDHIGKIIIQEIYDEDEQWCNFQREENEVLELMVGEMITHQMVKVSKEEWLD